MEFKYKVLKGVEVDRSIYEKIETQIVELFRQEVYLPLLAELGEGKTLLKNSSDDLVAAIRSGRIRFYRGSFNGRFNAAITRELKRLGAEWDRKNGSFRVPLSQIPHHIRAEILASEDRMNRAIDRINTKLYQMAPEEIADKLQIERIFDKALWKMDRDIMGELEGFTVAPQLTDEGRAKIAAEYTNDLKRYIVDFTDKETKKLRGEIQQNVFSGSRYEGIIGTIQKSYGVSYNKAKFLARQETNLMMTKFQETRYLDAGVPEYEWQCVVGSPAHPVRPAHKLLDRTRHSWDNPPITTEPGQVIRRNHPGQDYGCRCKARPVVKFR